MTWPTKKLGEAIGFLKGKKMSVSEEQGLGYEPYIGIDTLRTHQYSLFTPEKDGVKCSKDDVLVVWDGAYAGTVGIEVSGFAGSTVAKVVIREPELGSHFLRYFWEFNGTKIRSAAQGAAIPHLSKTFINNLKVPLPPLKIQQKIVERLDAIKKAQELNDKQIELAEELFQSLLHRELDSKGKNWGVKRMGEVTQIESGGTPSTQNLEYWNGKILWLTPKELSNFQDIEIYDTERKITQLGLDCSSAKLLPAGAVLLTSRAPIGYIVVAGKSMATNQGFKNFICKGKLLNNKFLYYFLKYKTKEIQSLGRGATFGEVSRTIVSNIKIPLPSLETQQKIVEKLFAVQEYKKKPLQQKEKLNELFESVLNKSFKKNYV